MTIVVMSDFPIDLRRLPPETVERLRSAAARIARLAVLELPEPVRARAYRIHLPPVLLDPEERAEGWEERHRATRYPGRVIENLLALFDELAARSAAGERLPLTVEELCRYNARLLDGIETNERVAPGRLRTCGIRVGNHQAPHYQTLPAHLERLFAWLDSDAAHALPDETTADAIMRAIALDYLLLLIHPFGDANGRVARTTEFAALLNAGVPDSIAHELNNAYNATRERFYRTLNQTVLEHEPLHFLVYAVEVFDERLGERLAEVEGGTQCERSREGLLAELRSEPLLHRRRQRWPARLLQRCALFLLDRLQGHRARRPRVPEAD